MNGLEIRGQPVYVTTHAIIRAREREISYPDQIYRVIKTGKVERFGKNGIKFIGKRSKKGCIICVGEDLGENIIIKTVERGN